MSWRKGFWIIIGMRLRKFVDLLLVAKPSIDIPEDKVQLIVVAGLFRTANGIGEGARGTYSALVAAGLSPIAVDLSEDLATVDIDVDIPLSDFPRDKKGILILQLNGPETIAGLHQLGMGRGRDWYTIGYWAWELAVFPTNWDEAFPFLSEVWVISEFTAGAIRQHEKSPKISVFGHAINAPKVINGNRAKFDIPEHAFVFLTMADSMSSFDRKNPFTAIEGFLKAFGQDPNVCLIVKTRNLSRNVQARKDLKEAIGKAENIKLIDSALSEVERWELLESADSVVSFHRSEGFGLVLAEAMAIGKAVIATAWSGNMDFTTSENCYLADYMLVPCDDRYGVYNETTASWAQVSTQEAARLMLEVYQNPDRRKEKGAMAIDDIKARASSKYLGASILNHLRISLDRVDGGHS